MTSFMKINFMKIITASSNWNTDQIYNVLKSNLNAKFKEARHMDIDFNIIKDGDTVEINQPEYYEGYLFRLTPQGKELHVAKSEHYVDDVNQLTLQSIIETLQMAEEEGADIVSISGE